MKFTLWSVWHILYILSPFVLFSVIYLCTRKASEKTKRIVGIVMGALSLVVIIARNVDIYVREGMGVEVIPFQVCHIGSIIVGLALIFKKKWLLLTAFCFNMMPGFLSIVFADSLVNYATLWAIRPQAYIWGHLLIVVGALYGIFVYKSDFNRKDLIYSLGFVVIMLVVAVFSNNAFRLWFGWTPNYFYIYHYDGTPLAFLYNATPTSVYGWFSINWLYTLTLIAVFGLVYAGLYFLAKAINIKNKKREA